jgi:transcriptional regulator with XRE-family HTH domain
MELQLRPGLIRTEREKRGWTQEQVAELTGLGVRTIQRVEATGTASAESATALAAVLEIPLATLRAGAAAGGHTGSRNSVIVDGLVLVTSAFAAMLFTPPNLVAQVPVLFMVGAYFFGRSRAGRSKAMS